MILILLGLFLMQLDLLEAAVRLSVLAAIPSILGSAALIAIIVCRQKITEYFKVSGVTKLDHEYRSSDTVILGLFAIAEFSLTGSAIIFGLMNHLFWH
jgi:hypothetical protein